MPKKQPSLKKLTLKIKYLNLELEEVKETFTHYNAKWYEYLVSLEQTYKIEIFPRSEKKVEKSSKKDSDLEKINLKRDRKQDELFKTLYRDIAKQAHPDKNNNDPDKVRLLRHATRAKNTDDLITMLDICDTLEIDTPTLSAHHIEIIEKNIKTKEEQINCIKNQDPWVYGEAHENENDKKLKAIEKAVVKRFKKDK